MSTTAVSFEVHLAGAVAEALDVASPVETDRIDYYDSGIWVDGPEGRSFYPWTNVLAIRERSSTADEPTSPAEEPAGRGDDEPEPESQAEPASEA